MDTYQTIITRRSIRKFKQEPVPDSVIKKILESARLAPSAANLQPCELIVVDEPKTRDKLFNALKWAGYIAPRGNPAKDERPLTYIVTITDKNKSPNWAVIDAAAAVENMILTAWAEGVASCWIGAINKDKIRDLLDVPGNYDIEFVLALGFPKEESMIEEFKGDIKYWKDEKGQMHVPKRNLKEIIHKNRF